MHAAANGAILRLVQQEPPVGDGTAETLVASPELTDDQLARLRGYGTPDALRGCAVGEGASAVSSVHRAVGPRS
jgi:hypothetical protein